MKVRFIIIIGLLFILAGLLLSSQLVIGCLKRTSACPIQGAGIIRTTQDKMTLSTSPAVIGDAVTGFPIHITIPNVAIDIDVAPGIYDAKKRIWTISGDKAYFATVTSQPNTISGSTYIYGHNRSSVFHNLISMPAGTSATVTTDNGHAFTYAFVSERSTSPDDVSVLEYGGAPVLTLQTCTGLLDQNRSLYTFKLVEVS